MKLALIEGPIGAVAFTLAIWAGYYPFVTTTSLPIGRYWLMLLTAIPVVTFFSEIAESVPNGVRIALVILGGSILAIAVKSIRGRNARNRPAR
jgi:hypothetical protein